MRSFDAQCRVALAPDMAYYHCVALCALDAVFSIRTNYSTVIKVLERFCKNYSIPLMATPSDKMPSTDNQLTVSELTSKMGNITGAQLATILHNHQLTSARGNNRILKADAFLQYLDVFKKYGVNTFQDVNIAFEKDDSLKNELKRIPGQNVSVDYFFMLAGDENGVKVDQHIRSFAEQAVGRSLSNDEIKALFVEEVKLLRADGYPNMTVRHLDHIVWNWQRSRQVPGQNHY